MHELYTWLEEQNGGVRTYSEFQQKTQQLADEIPDNAAILTLLSRVAERFVARFEGEPLSVDDAQAALEELKQILSEANDIPAASSDQKLAFANKVAGFDLLEGQST